MPNDLSIRSTVGTLTRETAFNNRSSRNPGNSSTSFRSLRWFQQSFSTQQGSPAGQSIPTLQTSPQSLVTTQVFLFHLPNKPSDLSSVPSYPHSLGSQSVESCATEIIPSPGSQPTGEGCSQNQESQEIDFSSQVSVFGD